MDPASEFHDRATVRWLQVRGAGLRDRLSRLEKRLERTRRPRILEILQHSARQELELVEQSFARVVAGEEPGV